MEQNIQSWNRPPVQLLCLAITIVFSLLAAHGAAAQAPGAVRIPWSAPPAEARAQLLQAGFSVEAGGDTAATNRRASTRLQERVYVRIRGGQHWNMTYSAVGDSAALQAQLDAVAADEAARSGAGAADGPRRVWAMEGGRRLSVPARPSRLADGATYQFVVLFYRP